MMKGMVTDPRSFNFLQVQQLRASLIQFNTHGSIDLRGRVRMMTRARRRRLDLLAKSSSSSEEASVQDQCQEFLLRDWANLTCDLVLDIAGRLLSSDVSEYYRLRAVCRPWRNHTSDDVLRAGHGGAHLDIRFRPRNWVVLTITPDAGEPRRRLLNIATGASIVVNLPTLTTHCHVGAADGLLILYHRTTKVISLLDPLTTAVTEFPAIDLSSIVATVTPAMAFYFSMFFPDPSSLDGHSINGACFDDSSTTCPLPTLVLCLRENLSCIIVAKPGDTHWTVVDQGKVYHTEAMGRVVFHSLLSFQGRCYVASPEGSVFLIELGRRTLTPPMLPRLVEVINQRQNATRNDILFVRILSYLVDGTGSSSNNGSGRMLMVRYWRNVEAFGGRGAYYDQTKLFTVGDVTGRIEVSEVDIAGRTLVPVSSLREYAAFVGMTHCMLVCTKTFPSVVSDVIYLGCGYQPSRKFSVYHLKTRTAEPLHEFRLDENQRVVPCARPCNLDQYLVAYVDRKHRLSGPCINHVAHYLFESLC